MVLVSIRDAEARTRFLGYRVESYKLFVFTLSACMAGVAGALYVPQVGIINPSEFAPADSIEAVIWVAVGGRGTLIGAVARRGPRQLRQDAVHLRGARALLAVHARRPVRARHAAAAARHRRHPAAHWRARAASAGGVAGRRRARRSRAEPRSDAMDKPHHLRAALSRRRHRVVRRLPRAQRSFAHRRAGRDARHHRPERRRQDHHDGRVTGKTRPDEGDVYFDGRVRSHRRWTKLRSPSSASAANSRSRPCSRCHTVEDNLRLALKGDRQARATLFWRETAHEQARIDEIFEIIRLGAVRDRVAGEPVARPEAMARDRHAAGAGPEAAAGRRAGRRHDRRRDARRPPSCSRRSTANRRSSWSSTT